MQSTQNYISPDDFDKVIYAIPALKIRKWSIESVQMLFKITYYCALRMSEAIKLKVSDFNLETNEVYLGSTKTNKRDYASIPPEFKPQLQVYFRSVQNPDGFLFYPSLNRQIVSVWINRLGKMLNIPAWTTPQNITHEKTKCHGPRKSMAKDMLYRKAPLSFVQAKLRHRDIKTTSEYLNVKLDEVKIWESQQSP